MRKSIVIFIVFLFFLVGCEKDELRQQIETLKSLNKEQEQLIHELENKLDSKLEISSQIAEDLLAFYEPDHRDTDAAAIALKLQVKQLYTQRGSSTRLFNTVAFVLAYHYYLPTYQQMELVEEEEDVFFNGFKQGLYHTIRYESDDKYMLVQFKAPYEIAMNTNRGEVFMEITELFLVIPADEKRPRIYIKNEDGEYQGFKLMADAPYDYNVLFVNPMESFYQIQSFNI